MEPTLATQINPVDWTVIWTVIATVGGSAIGIIGINIALFSWLRSDIKSFDTKINSLEERMFWLATGKTLPDAILEEKMKMERR